jgi:hypothetical protein
MSTKKADGVGGRKRVVRPYTRTARKYQELMQQLELNQRETAMMLGFAHRTSRRYKRGEGKVPLSALILMRLMADGVVTKRQVMRAAG